LEGQNEAEDQILTPLLYWFREMTAWARGGTCPYAENQMNKYAIL